MSRLPLLVAAAKVQVGIIAVPAASAQEVADRLILAGVGGLLNLAYTHVLAPPRVPVVDARIMASLQELCYTLKAAEGVGRRRAGRTPPGAEPPARSPSAGAAG